MKEIKFDKYQGNGNDFIIVDLRELEIYKDFLLKEILDIKLLCNRNFGIGADGVIFITKSNKNCDAKMIIYNSDNSEAEMCGNGIRCLIEYLNQNNNYKNESCEYKIETKAGIKIGKYESGEISVKMGKPILRNNLIPTTFDRKKNEILFKSLSFENFEANGYAVGMGNPHLIFFIDNIKSISHHVLGPVFENDKSFPEKTNVHFCQIKDLENIEVLVWERGAGATLACGTGACAVHVAAYKLGLCKSKTKIILPGGHLHIDWKDIDEEVIMIGKAKKVFTGIYKLN
tara:strand:- start:4140 stop:5000 length:861 start_codon:yes stop_codon:yes gene_type:complete